MILRNQILFQKPEYFREAFFFNSYFTLIEGKLKEENFEFKSNTFKGYKINILIKCGRDDIIIPFIISKRDYHIKEHSAHDEKRNKEEEEEEEEEEKGKTIDFFYEYDNNTFDNSNTIIENMYGFSINFSSNQIEKYDQSLSMKISIDNCIKVSKIQNVYDHKNKSYWFNFKDDEIKISLCSDIYLNLTNNRNISNEIKSNPFKTIIIENLDTYLSDTNF